MYARLSQCASSASSSSSFANPLDTHGIRLLVQAFALAGFAFEEALEQAQQAVYQ